MKIRHVQKGIVTGMFLCTLNFFLLLSGQTPETVLPKGTASASKQAATIGQAITRPERLNVRISPNLRASVATVLPRGSHVKILGKKGEWLCIRLPRSAPVWMAKSMLSPDLIPEKNSPMRTGPGVAYDSYGCAPAEPVRILESARDGKWVRMEPPSGLMAWINEDYVTYSRAGTASDVIPSTGAREENPDRAEVAAQEPFLPEYNRVVSMEGTILPIRNNPLATHALTIRINQSYYPFAYIATSNSTLRLWEKRDVRVDALCRWTDHSIYPYLEVEKITPAWNTAPSFLK